MTSTITASAPSMSWRPCRRLGSASPAGRAPPATIRIGYSATQLNTKGATRPAAMPPIVPPAAIQR